VPRPYFGVKFGDQRRKRSGESRTCPTCGVQFYTPQSRLPGSGFCSVACRSKSRRTTSICITCGKTFSVLMSIKERFRNCSIECARTHTHHVNCARCGKLFRGNSDGSSRHCSEECYRPPVVRDCKHCGKSFRIVPTSNSIFCSFACYRRHRGETRPEAVARQALALIGLDCEQEYQVKRYSIDFVFLPRKIAIEVDGVYWHDEEKDAKKTASLKKLGWKVCRVVAESLTDIDTAAHILRNEIKLADPGIQFTAQPRLF
jgi:very-short-patch-repair endonuclease